MTLLLSGCGTATHAATNPPVGTDETQARACAQKCASKANFLTRGERRGFIACLGVSRGNELAVGKRAQREFATEGALTRAARKRLINDGVSPCTLR